MDKITINLEIEDGKVKGMDIVNGMYDRTEYCNSELDEEMSIQDALYEIEEYIKGY